MTPIVVCIKVGTKYGPEYVNRLASMVETHLTRPHEFVCLTDEPSGVNCPTAPVGTDLPGWWAKLVLFKPHPSLAGRRIIFLDLDTVIVGNMDFVLDYDGPLAILRDFYRPNGYGSAILSISPLGNPGVWEQFEKGMMRQYHGDQDWIQACMRGDLWQDLSPGKIVSYKVHCQEGVPSEASIVCFHGEPRPHQVSHLPWMQEHWHDRTAVTR
jgi:hypothetical protein